jgi:hypothetical protein
VPRVLRIVAIRVNPEGRAEYIERARDRRETFRAHGCNFWVYEDAGTLGAFTEFVEAKDPGAIRDAIAADTPVGRLSLSPILTEVELS